jgi:methylated-DNA-[protein]-cysteine S-methyltransferase
VTATASYCLFDTAVGRCGIAWRGAAIIAFALAGADDAATEKRLAAGAAPSPAPAFVEQAIDAIRRLLAGEAADLRFIPVDMSAVPPFERQVYETLRDVPPGETVTYGELAARCGAPGAARAVGAAMGRNPFPVIIPCHRVLASDGRSVGFSAPGGVSTKFKLLQIEQARRGSEDLLFADLPLAVRS